MSENNNLLQNTMPLTTGPFPHSRRIPVQMLVHDGKPCPTDLVPAYTTPNHLSAPFTPNGNYFAPASTIIPPNSQYYVHNGWSW